jgi:hypothetical protein
MNIILHTIANSITALMFLILPFQVTAGDSATATDMKIQGSSASMGDTLVIVNKVVGVDANGKQHILYNEENGRVYRLDNIEQSIHDLNARGIESKGTFRSLRAVLSDTVYLFGENSNPYPVQRIRTSIPESLALSVENLHVTKDRVIAVYTTNCDNNSI